MGIPYWLIPWPGAGFILYVDRLHAEAAREQCAAYEREQSGPVPPPEPTPSGAQSSISLLVYALLLSAMYVFTTTRLLRIGRSSEAAIRDGELWRVVTGLTLHADWPHMAGNMVGGILLAMLLFRFTGYGAGWLLILLTGALGNLLNALLHAGTGHSSIGASTAVFGTLGLVVGLRLSCQLRQRAGAGSLRSWIPLLGGIAMLGLLGAGGARTDVTAHLLGFAVGVLAGGTLGALRLDETLARLPPWRFWLPALTLVAAAWAAAWLRGGSV